MDDTLDNLPTFDPEFEPSAAELKEGQFLGENQNYRLEKNLGVGGMGEVWLAAEIRAGQEIRKVVVKTLRPDRRGNEGAQEKALKQFQLIQSLNHQNICPIYVIEKDPACGYLIVMGYAGGGSFADWFAGKPKPLAEVCRVLRPIADALDFAHSKGVIHRDVKPSNMMFTSDGTPWLIDFGIAANLRTATQATTGQYGKSGTDSYMAPEQKSGQLQKEQTDEYSLALVVLEFLTGTTYLQAIQKLPSEIQPILNKALALDLSDRYATCRAFIDALSSPRKDVGSPSAAGPAAQSAIDQIVEVERLAAEAKRRAEEEALQKKIQDLDKQAAEEYQSARYVEAINHLSELLRLRPNHPNTQWLLKSCQEKREIQKKEEAERKAREEAERKAKEVAERRAREEAERKAKEEAEEQRRRVEEELRNKGFEVEGTILKKYTGKETCVAIPEGVTAIGEWAFHGCSFLTSVVIPEGVKKIGWDAFRDCSSLTTVVIPDSIKEIEGRAFAFCPILKEWRISSTHPYYKCEGIALFTNDGKKLITCPGAEGQYAIPIGTREIEAFAFRGCSSLTSVVIPKSVTAIGRGAFCDCGSLTLIEIPEGVTKIRKFTFESCRSLTFVKVPRSVKGIEINAFKDCPKLKIEAPIFSYAWWRVVFLKWLLSSSILIGIIVGIISLFFFPLGSIFIFVVAAFCYRFYMNDNLQS